MHVSTEIHRLPRARFLPKHAPGLDRSAYLAYFASAFGRGVHPTLEEVWRPLLPERRLLPTPTGRHALFFFLEALDFAPGDEVLVPAFNYFVVVRVLVQKGLVPIFVDVDPGTLCMDPEAAAAKVTARTRLVVATHMFGNPAPMQALKALCAEHGLALFEDCAHAVGTIACGLHAGLHGDGALFSFGLWKSLSSFGGGMLCLAPGVADAFEPPAHRAPWLRSAGQTAARVAVSSVLRRGAYGYVLHPMLEVASALARAGHTALRDLLAPPRDDAAYRFHVDERAPFRAFMPRVHASQLARLDSDVARRRSIVGMIKRELRGVREVQFLREDEHGRANASYAGMLVPNPEALSAHLERLGIVTRAHEFLDCAARPQFAPFRAHCPHASKVTRHLLRVPSFAALTNEDVYGMTRAIRSYFRREERAVHFARGSAVS